MKSTLYEIQVVSAKYNKYTYPKRSTVKHETPEKIYRFRTRCNIVFS